LGTFKVAVSRIGVSISPSSFTCVEPASYPKALPMKTAPGTFSRNMLPECGRDGGDAGVNVVALIQSNLADLHASYVGDRIERAAGKYADFQSQITGARPLILLLGQGGRGERQT
jgi:hypothetical protein